jgi:hypothetical protein
MLQEARAEEIQRNKRLTGIATVRVFNIRISGFHTIHVQSTQDRRDCYDSTQLDHKIGK